MSDRKRSRDRDGDGQREGKKHKSEHGDRNGRSYRQQDYHGQRKEHHKHARARESYGKEHRKQEAPAVSYEDALAQLPPPTSKSGQVPAYVPFTVPSSLPALPPIEDAKLAAAPFKHKSTSHHARVAPAAADITYERLEFLGDAYIELIASRLLYERFSHLSAGQQSQLRELLVKNETLAEFSRAYHLDQRVEVAAMQDMLDASKGHGNKGFNKVLGDVFEAYVAAVIVSHPDDGFAIAEKWLTALWAPKLLEAVRNDRSYAVRPHVTLTHDEDADPRTIYNPNAKGDLQKRILHSGIALSYERYKASEELKGDQLGQNRHFIALYLTGYEYKKRLLGKGEGKNKVEAGNWAATEAMFGEAKDIVDECEERLKEIRAKRAEERAKAEEASQG